MLIIKTLFQNVTISKQSLSSPLLAHMKWHSSDSFIQFSPAASSRSQRTGRRSAGGDSSLPFSVSTSSHTFLFSVAATPHWWRRSGGLREVSNLLTLRSDSIAHQFTQLLKLATNYFIWTAGGSPLLPQWPAVSRSQTKEGQAPMCVLLCASSLGTWGHTRTARLVPTHVVRREVEEEDEIALGLVLTRVALGNEVFPISVGPPSYQIFFPHEVHVTQCVIFNEVVCLYGIAF